MLKSPKTKTLVDGLAERTLSMLDKIESKTMHKAEIKTLSEVKPVENVNKNLQSFLEISPRLRNTGLVSSGDSLTSWGEGASLALVGNPSSDGITIKMPYGVDVLHQPASHPIFSYWVG